MNYDVRLFELAYLFIFVPRFPSLGCISHAICCIMLGYYISPLMAHCQTPHLLLLCTGPLAISRIEDPGHFLSQQQIHCRHPAALSVCAAQTLSFWAFCEYSFLMKMLSGDHTDSAVILSWNNQPSFSTMKTLISRQPSITSLIYLNKSFPDTV